MNNPKNQKFNSKGATKGYFPIKQHRFDTTKHPIIQSSARCAAKLQTLLSQQEHLMVSGLVNCLQCDERDAVRIALYELLNNSDREVVDSLVAASSSGSKLKGHTSRDRKLSLALPGQEKADAEELADELGMTPKELLRLAIIHLAKGIRTEQIIKLTTSRKISQQELAKQWSRANQGKPPSARTKALKEAAAQAYKEASDLGELNDEYRYKERGRMMNVLNWEGVGRAYAMTNPDGSGSIPLEFVDVHLQMERDDDGWWNELEDKTEQLAEDRRKAVYTEAIAIRWFADYGEDLTDEDLDWYWQDYLERNAEEQRNDDDEELQALYASMELHGPAENITDEEMLRRRFGERKPIDLSHLDQQPEEVRRDWLLRISGQQIVDRLEISAGACDDPRAAQNRWWLRLTGKQYKAAEAIEQQTGKSYEHITLSEIEEYIRNSGSD